MNTIEAKLDLISRIVSSAPTLRIYTVQTDAAAGTNINVLTFNGSVYIRGLQLIFGGVSGGNNPSVVVKIDEMQYTGPSMGGGTFFLFRAPIAMQMAGTVPTTPVGGNMDFPVGQQIQITATKVAGITITATILYDDINGNIIGAAATDANGNPVEVTDPSNTVLYSTEQGIVNFTYNDMAAEPDITVIPYPTT